MVFAQEKKNQLRDSMCSSISLHLGPLTSPQPDSLAELLELGEKLIAMFNHFRVLPVFIVWPISLDNAVYPVDGTVELFGRDELREITTPKSAGDLDKESRGTYRSNQSTETPNESAMF